jgi:hypothetical protein
MNGSKAVSGNETSLRDLLTLCLAENNRRFAG